MSPENDGLYHDCYERTGSCPICGRSMTGGSCVCIRHELALEEDEARDYWRERVEPDFEVRFCPDCGREMGDFCSACREHERRRDDPGTAAEWRRVLGPK